jgi:hypothetical protein
MTEPNPAEVAKELVLATTELDAKPLDNVVSKLADYVECQNSIEFWKKRLERLKKELAEIMGETEVGTVNGEAALFYERQNRFRTGEFAKKYPDFHRLYSRDFTEKRFDPEWLKDQRPDLYEQFQVRAMRITFDA